MSDNKVLAIYVIAVMAAISIGALVTSQKDVEVEKTKQMELQWKRDSVAAVTKNSIAISDTTRK
jgi:hypothetical protein